MTKPQFTDLLLAWRAGDQAALNQLAGLVQAELHRLAHHYLLGERAGHTLQTTALVNEAWGRLIEQSEVSWQDRAHFMGVAAVTMRHVLVDFARARNYDKRGGGAIQVTLDEAVAVTPERLTEIVALHEALERLAEFNANAAKVVELRYFVGLQNKEIAEVMGVSEVVATRYWKFALAWLRREFGVQK